MYDTPVALCALCGHIEVTVAGERCCICLGSNEEVSYETDHWKGFYVA